MAAYPEIPAMTAYQTKAELIETVARATRLEKKTVARAIELTFDHIARAGVTAICSATSSTSLPPSQASAACSQRFSSVMKMRPPPCVRPSPGSRRATEAQRTS